MNLETRRLLNMRERAAIRDAHTFTFWHDGTHHRATCACGHTLAPTVHAHVITATALDHVEQNMEFAAGRKCAEARANADTTAARINTAIEEALWDGLTAQERAGLRLECDIYGIPQRVIRSAAERRPRP